MATPVKKAAPAKKAAPRKKVPVEITAAHAKDIKTIAEAMKKVAEENDLCDLFYSTVDELNKKLVAPVPVKRPLRKCSAVLTLCISGSWELGATPNSWDIEYSLPDEVEEAIEQAMYCVSGVTQVDVSVDSVEVDVSDL